MPTDPYVSPNLEDSPRHKQNLPAGIAVPPPSPWMADRPGEVGPNEPKGRLFGRPGPNIGYALTLVDLQKDSWKLAPHEHLHDVGPVVAEIAMKRAASFGRAPVKADIDVAVALLGYDGEVDETWATARTELVHDGGHDYPKRRRLVDAVPDSLARSALADARARAPEWRRTMLSAFAAER
jgi:hypothetical protein